MWSWKQTEGNTELQHWAVWQHDRWVFEAGKAGKPILVVPQKLNYDHQSSCVFDIKCTFLIASNSLSWSATFLPSVSSYVSSSCKFCKNMLNINNIDLLLVFPDSLAVLTPSTKMICSLRSTIYLSPRECSIKKSQTLLNRSRALGRPLICLSWSNTSPVNWIPIFLFNHNPCCLGWIQFYTLFALTGAYL